MRDRPVTIREEGWSNSILASGPVHFHDAVMNLFYCFLVGVWVLVLTGCGGGETTRTDPKNLVTYTLPAGWKAVPASGETRFSPPGGGAEIQINTLQLDKPRKLEAERDAWLSFQEEQGMEIIESGSYAVGELTGVSFANEAETSMGASIQHLILLQQPGLLVMTHLMTGKDRYEELLPVYESVVKSIRPLN